MRSLLPMPVIAIGAAFDFHSGRLRQAPAALQRLGLEWLFRLRAPSAVAPLSYPQSHLRLPRGRAMAAERQYLIGRNAASQIDALRLTCFH